MELSPKDRELAKKYRNLVFAYLEHAECLRINTPHDVEIEHNVMEGFKGNIYSGDDVASFLANHVEEGDKGGLERVFGYIENDTRTARDRLWM